MLHRWQITQHIFHDRLFAKESPHYLNRPQNEDEYVCVLAIVFSIILTYFACSVRLASVILKLSST